MFWLKEMVGLKQVGIVLEKLEKRMGHCVLPHLYTMDLPTMSSVAAQWLVVWER